MLRKFIRSGRVGSGHRNLTRVQLWSGVVEAMTAAVDSDEDRCRLRRVSAGTERITPGRHDSAPAGPNSVDLVPTVE